MIHVCFGLHDKTGRYSKFTGTAMLSMFENTSSKITVHILHDNTLSTDNRDKFIYLAGQYGQRVKFYNVEELCVDKIEEIKLLIPNVLKSRFSIATFYRLLIPQLLSTEIEKCIYLDSDVIVNIDIKELWKIKLKKKPLGANAEMEVDYLYHPINAPKKYLIANNVVKYEDYFNAGVLLLNMIFFRENKSKIIEGLKFFNLHPEQSCFDQDILNRAFSKNYVRLPINFNKFVEDERQSRNEIQYAIYHYARNAFQMEVHDPFNRLWMKYFVQTPWFDEETIGRLYAGVQQIHVGLKSSMVNLSAIMSGKTRGFFAPPNNINELKKFFRIRDDEEIIPAENQDSLKKLLDAMNASRGKKVFFIMVPFPFQILIQAGFAPGRDFVNGFEFLSEAQGVPLNSYPLIQAM